MYKKYHLGCIRPEKKDERDYTYISKTTYDSHIRENGVSPISPLCKNLYISNISQPSSSFIVPSLSPIIDQGALGSCAVNAQAFCISTMTKNKLNLSRLTLYALSRIVTGIQLNEQGTAINMNCESIRIYGVCDEFIFPYINIAENSIVVPPINALKNSFFLNNYQYFAVDQSLDSLRQCLFEKQVPIIFGFAIWENFFSADNDGIVPMPTKNEKWIGGHAVVMVGYDDSKKWFKCANSWGPDWGDNGFFYMPYDLIINPQYCFSFYYLSFNY